VRDQQVASQAFCCEAVEEIFLHSSSPFLARSQFREDHPDYADFNWAVALSSLGQMGSTAQLLRKVGMTEKSARCLLCR
jgi:hypothetical protein